MAEKMMILTNSYQFGEKLRKMLDWNTLGMEIVSIEYNGAIGLEQFSYFRPRIVLLDSMVPIIGIDKFVDEMSRVSADFLVILLDDLDLQISNIQNIYRVIKKSQLSPSAVAGAVQDAVKALTRKFDTSSDDESDTRLYTVQKLLGGGDFSISNLQTLRDRVGVNLSPEVTILLPRPAEIPAEPISKEVIRAIRYVLNENQGGEVIPMNDGVLCILINDGLGVFREKEYENLMIDIRRILVGALSVQWTFVLSDPVQLNMLNQKYNEYRMLYEYGYFRSELPILRKEYVITRSIPRKDRDLPAFYKTLIDAIVQGDEKIISACLKSACIDHIKLSMDKERLVSFRNSLEAVRLSFLCLEGKRIRPGEEKPFFEDPPQNIEAEAELLTDFFTDLSSGYRKTGKKVNTLIYGVLSILVHQYPEDLSLMSVAGEVNAAVTYLSHLFKKETNYTFSEFLTQIRLDISCRMLREKEYKIHEIAMKTGFSDSRYFSRVFKKELGVSPSDYRSGGDSGQREV